MNVKFQTFAALRDAINSRSVMLEFRGKTLNEFIIELCKAFPKLSQLLFPSGEFDNSLVIIHNDVQISYSTVKDIVLQENDRVIILPPTGGGLR